MPDSPEKRPAGFSKVMVRGKRMKECNVALDCREGVVALGPCTRVSLNSGAFLWTFLFVLAGVASKPLIRKCCQGRDGQDAKS